MISRRNYLIIVIIMGIVFVLFQFSQFIRDYSNNYTYNEYSELSTPKNNEWIQNRIVVGKDNSLEGQYILFLGDISTDIGSIVSQWTVYTKRELAILNNLNDFDYDKYKAPDFLLVDSAYVDYKKQTDILISLSDAGIPIVFLNLPTVNDVENIEGLSSLLGISYVREENVTVDGISLFSGFLLGGSVVYMPEKEEEEKRQDLDLKMPWYITAGGSKTYMVGIMENYFGEYEYEDELYQNDFYPAIIWRNSRGSGQVFCVNGDYMSQTTGLGILSSIIYEMSDYSLYPVVNAQNTLVVNFPLMSDENDEEFSGIYSRSLGAFQTDVIWPTLVSLAEKDNLKFTCFISPKYDYKDDAKPKYERYNTLLQLFNERDTELGLSLEHANGIDLLSKLAIDKEFYDGIENKYDCTSAFMSLSDTKLLEEAVKYAYVRNVRTIACDADVNLPILSYLNENITLQSLTSNTKNFTYSKDLMLKSIETVLGYDNAKIDISSVAWPEDEFDHWEKIYDDMSSSLVTYWKPYRVFDETTLTESDQRVRTFLNLNSSSQRNGNEIILNVDGTDGFDCWFILRTHGEKIDYIQGADFIKIEEDAYLLTVTKKTVKIGLASTQTIK